MVGRTVITIKVGLDKKTGWFAVLWELKDLHIVTNSPKPLNAQPKLGGFTGAISSFDDYKYTGVVLHKLLIIIPPYFLRPLIFSGKLRRSLYALGNICAGRQSRTSFSRLVLRPDWYLPLSF